MNRFFENYRDPRWQKKRLEVMERDGFGCVNCGERGRELHVNHKFYRDQLKPWEYENCELETLCDNCHKRATAAQRELRSDLCLLSSAHLNELRGHVLGMVLEDDSVQLSRKAVESLCCEGWAALFSRACDSELASAINRRIDASGESYYKAKYFVEIRAMRALSELKWLSLEDITGYFDSFTGDGGDR